MCYVHNSKHVEHFNMGIKCKKCGAGLYILCVGQDEWVEELCRKCYLPETIKTKYSKDFSNDKIQNKNIIKPLVYSKEDEGVLIHDEKQNESHISSEQIHLINYIEQQTTQSDQLNIQPHFEYILEGRGPFGVPSENKITGLCLIGVVATPFGVIICDETINEQFENDVMNAYQPKICTEDPKILDECSANFERSNGAFKLHSCGYNNDKQKFFKSDLPKGYLPEDKEKILKGIAEYFVKETVKETSFDQKTYILSGRDLEKKKHVVQIGRINKQIIMELQGK